MIILTLRTIGSVIFLFCLCVCAGCGGYGYRRHYVVRTYQAPPNHATVVTTTTARTGEKLKMLFCVAFSLYTV